MVRGARPSVLEVAASEWRGRFEMNADDSNGGEGAPAASSRFETTLLPKVRRMFSPKTFALGVACIAGAVASAVLVKLVWDFSRRVAAAAIALTIVCGLGAPLLLIASLFTRGCSNCRKVLELRKYAYPPTKYSMLSKKLKRGGEALSAFLETPAERGPHAAVLTVMVCPKCERLAAVRLAERAEGPKGEAQQLRTTEERWLAPAELDWLIALRNHRP
jgi:hypothetical protein